MQWWRLQPCSRPTSCSDGSRLRGTRPAITPNERTPTRNPFGDPADELIEEAAEGKYGLAVAGSRGLSASGGLLRGSLSRKLVKRMPCPVIVAGPGAGLVPALSLERDLVAEPSQPVTGLSSACRPDTAGPKSLSGSVCPKSLSRDALMSPRTLQRGRWSGQGGGRMAIRVERASRSRPRRPPARRRSSSRHCSHPLRSRAQPGTLDVSVNSRRSSTSTSPTKTLVFASSSTAREGTSSPPAWLESCSAARAVLASRRRSRPARARALSSGRLRSR